MIASQANWPELLAPAGDLEKLQFAYLYGADAAYVGAGDFSLRTASGLSSQDIQAAVKLADQMGRKLYVAVNAFASDDDLRQLPPFLEQLAAIHPHGLIVSDPGVFRLCQRYAPQLPLHISTQSNSMNSETLRFWAEQGASRVVLSRELSLAQAQAAAALPDIESEIFVHGAICISYSGRCLISSYLTGRSANHGDCAQPCRWSYALCEEKRPDEYFPITEDERGSYFFNSRDLCLLPYVPQLMRAGFSSWKIEGRNKSAYYVANVVRIYKAAMTAWQKDPDAWCCQSAWLEELAKVSHRQYTDNFALLAPGPEAFRYAEGQPVRGYDFAAVAYGSQDGLLQLEQRNHLQIGDVLEVLLPDDGLWSFPITAIFDEDGQRINAACHPRQRVAVEIPADSPTLESWPLICRRCSR